jgi:addiction module HigA family antidote
MKTITDRGQDAPRRKRTRPPAHPGRILKNLYLVPLGVSNTELARVLGVSRKAVSRIVNEHKSVTPEMALRLSGAFPNTAPEFWLNLQKNYDLWHAAHDSLDWQNVRPIVPDVPAAPIVYPDLSEQRALRLNALRENSHHTQAHGQEAEETQGQSE